MTAVMAPPARVRSKAAVAALAGWEGRRLWRSPLLWVGTLAGLAVIYLEIRFEAVSLPRLSVLVAGACLAVAAMGLLGAHTLAARSSRQEMEEMLGALPVNSRRRRSGELAAAWAPALLAVGVVTAGLSFGLTRHPAGTIDWLEVAVGPLIVVLGHVVGAGLGRLRHPLIGPLALVVVAGLFLVKDFWPGERVIPAASRFLPWRAPYTDWVQGEPRLPGLHLVYLLFLIGLIGAWALRAWRWLAGSSAALAATAAVLATIPTHGLEVAAAVEAWGREQPYSCLDREGVRYCAFQGYEPWIDHWAASIRSAREVVPVPLLVKEVRQTTGFPDDDDPAMSYVGGTWYLGSETGRGGAFAFEVVAPTLGLPGTPGELALLQPDLADCMRGRAPMSVFGEARGVGLLVLLGLFAPEALPTDAFGGSAGLQTVEVAASELSLAHQILQRPPAEIVSVLHPRWEEVSEPDTTSAALASWFGLPAPTVPEQSPTEASFEAMDCVCNPEGTGYSCSSREP